MADDSTDEQSSSDESPEERKRKFREALDRKKANSSGANPKQDAGGKQLRAHGPAESRRDFRRKSI